MPSGPGAFLLWTFFSVVCISSMEISFMSSVAWGRKLLFGEGDVKVVGCSGVGCDVNWFPQYLTNSSLRAWPVEAASWC